MAVLVAATIPNLATYQQHWAPKVELKRLLRLLEQQSLKAQQSELALTLQRKSNSELIITSQNEQNRIKWHRLKIIKINANVSGSITFFPSGTATPATLWIDYRNKLCRISISIYGQTTDNCQT